MTPVRIKLDFASSADSCFVGSSRQPAGPSPRTAPFSRWRLDAVLAGGGMILLTLISVAGCGAATARVPVSGRVLVDGQPLTTGKIVVAPENDRPAFGTIDAEGRFTLTTEVEGDGCVTGSHRVAVSATDRTNPNQVRWLVPSKYGDLFKSELKAEIRGPTNDLVIELHQSYEDPSSRILIEQGDAVPNQPTSPAKE